jgi:hypothetical protein
MGAGGRCGEQQVFHRVLRSALGVWVLSGVSALLDVLLESEDVSLWMTCLNLSRVYIQGPFSVFLNPEDGS